MYPYTSNVFSTSSTTENHYEPATFLDQPFLIHSRPFMNDISTDPNSNFSSVASSSNQEQDLLENSPHHLHLPLSFFHFPSPLEDGDVLLQQQQQPQQEQQQQQQQQQKRIPTMRRSSSSKKDRHSKIRTARGLRDRRMRLSLEVALKFFGLQDMLGFDKASKTVEWLLNQAAAAIRKLKDDMNENQSSISECEAVSGTDEAATDDHCVIKKISRKPSSSSSCPKTRKRTVQSNPLAKASRVQARAKARQRTEEKMRRQQPKPLDDVDHQEKLMKLDLSRLSSWSSTFETGEGSRGTTQSHNDWNNNHSSMEVVLAEVEEPISSFQAAGTTLGVHQDLIEIDGYDAAANLVTMGKWSPYSNFSSLQNTPASISQEQQQFADSQFYGKPWEVVYNSSSIHNGF